MDRGGDERRIELLRHARQGDTVALNQLLESLRPDVRRFLSTKLQSHPATSAQAEELAQRVLLRVARSLDSVQATSSGELWAWVRTTAHRVLIDRYRKRRRALERREWGSEEAVLAQATLQEVFGISEPSSSDEEADPDLVLGRLLLEAQQELSEGTQEVVRRHVLLNETWQETGEAIGTTGPGAKRRWQRAVPRLRRELLTRLRSLPDDLRQAALRRLGIHGPELGTDEEQ